jgi:hypothetical protein
MTELSPTAQAVLDAVADRYSQLATMSTAVAAAAALRAAVAHTQQHRGDGLWVCHANDLLAIAAELDPPP